MSHEDNAAESDAQAPDGALDRYGNPADHPSFNQFVATISALRAPDGCPWDREQTHVSISHNMIEEAYEAVCAIEEEDVAHLREELGDVLLQVVLQSQIAADAGEFTIDDVCSDVNAKMVRRHPHVFGSVEASNASEVLDVWDQVKLAERQATGGADGSGCERTRRPARRRAAHLPRAHGGAEDFPQGCCRRLRMGLHRGRVGQGRRGESRAHRGVRRCPAFRKRQDRHLGGG